MEARCRTSYCLGEDGFPKLLSACAARLGIQRQPEYDGCEFEEHGTDKCVVTMYMGASQHHEEWRITASRHRFKDTYQVAARKALRALCQIYEEEVAEIPTLILPVLAERPSCVDSQEACFGRGTPAKLFERPVGGGGLKGTKNHCGIRKPYPRCSLRAT